MKCVLRHWGPLAVWDCSDWSVGPAQIPAEAAGLGSGAGWFSRVTLAGNEGDSVQHFKARFPNSSGFPPQALVPRIWSSWVFGEKISETHQCRSTNISSYKLFWGVALTSFVSRAGNPALLEVNRGEYQATREIWSGSKLTPVCSLLPASPSQAREAVPGDGKWGQSSQLLCQLAEHSGSPLPQLGAALDHPPTRQPGQVFWGQVRELQASWTTDLEMLTPNWPCQSKPPHTSPRSSR